MNQQVIYFLDVINNVIHPNKKKELNSDIDWSYVVQLARKHNLMSICMEEAVKYPAYKSREEHTREEQEVLGSVSSQTKRTSNFLRLYKAFDREGIRPIVLKGLICRQMYGDLCDHRPSGDEDLYVSISEYEKAKNILLKCGYELAFGEDTEKQFKKMQEISFRHPDEKLHIELHLNLMGMDSDAHSKMSDYFRHVFENYREIEIHGVTVRAMSHQDHLLYLIFHAFKHFISGGFGVRQMLDILLYQEKYGTEINMEKLNHALKEFKLNTFFNDMIYLGNTYLGFDLNMEGITNCPQDLLDDVISAGVFGRTSEADLIAGRTIEQAAGNYLRNKSGNTFTMIWKAIFPSRKYMLFNAPYLESKPWLLPVAWCRRWIKFIKKSNSKDQKLAIQSVKISNQRMGLLKKYDLL